MIVRCGLEALAPLLEEVGIRQPLLVTSARFAALDLPVAARYTGVRRHAPVATVEEATAAAGADGLVGLGGGSAVDTAKAVLARTGLPLVCVPTTYAGAEWTPSFGMRDEARRIKAGGSGARTVGIVYDAQLTLSLSREESGGTAMNALAHCVEALYPGDLEQGRQGAAGIRRFLPRVLEDGSDLEARRGLLEAARWAGEALARMACTCPTPWPRPSAGATGSPTGPWAPSACRRPCASTPPPLPSPWRWCRWRRWRSLPA